MKTPASGNNNSSSSKIGRKKKKSSNLRQVILLGILLFLVLNAALFLVLWPSAELEENRGSRKSHHHSPGKLILPKTFVENDNNGKVRVLQILRDAGVTEETLQQSMDQLPTWNQVVQQYGDKPVIVGLDSCPVFRQRVPAVQRMLGAAGMFSTGTNLVTQLLKQNCVIPERFEEYGPDATKEQYGMRWQVPWGKHTPQHYKWQHATQQAAAIDKHAILPVVTIRHPYRWMRSMCKNPYTARWSHASKCPNLVVTGDNNNNNNNEYNPVSVKYGAATESYQSLAHLWNDWYNDYYQTAVDATTTDAHQHDITNDEQQQQHYPWLMIRIEDLVFHTVETITTVCECAGGQIRSSNSNSSNNQTQQQQSFQYIKDSAKKDSPGHDTSTGIAEAWIQYARPLAVRAGLDPADYRAAVAVLDPHLMQLFGYQHPPDG